MPTVSNKATGDVADRSYVNNSRTNAGTPNGALVPAFAGEVVMDTTGHQRYRANGLTNQSWVPITETRSV
jgi:hypothetical protein